MGCWSWNCPPAGNRKALKSWLAWIHVPTRPKVKKRPAAAGLEAAQPEEEVAEEEEEAEQEESEHAKDSGGDDQAQKIWWR